MGLTMRGYHSRRFCFVYGVTIACFVLVVLQSQMVFQLVRTGHDNNVIYNSDRISVHDEDRIQRTKDVKTNAPMVSLDDFRHGAKTGNSLIDDYGNNDPRVAGEMGRGIALTDEQNDQVKVIVDKFKVNNLVSDLVPLNRIVPDSRLPGCSSISYNVSSLPSVSIVIPFYDEWPSLILRTVYSIINRTPRRLLRDIILVDDNSTIQEVKDPLDRYIQEHFPKGLVQVIRMSERKGLSTARMEGAGLAKGDVLVFFDSHMEVNVDWLPPLLTEIVKNPKVVAMSHLDYIKWDTFEYHFDRFWMVKYGWHWKMSFFETYFRPDEIGLKATDARPGTTMVGSAFAIDKKYFYDMGGYDTQMSIWGGENLEMTWRITLCGGKLLHLPCSKIGHVARGQPYSFPGGYGQLLMYNWKRGVSVWMGNYSRFVYKELPDMKAMEVGDLTERLALRDRLKCKDFGWYMKNVWQELNVYDEDVIEWGQVANEASEKCLDNDGYIFQARAKLYLQPCHGSNLHKQGFSLTKKGRLRTTLQCVIATGDTPASKVALEDCLIGPPDTWRYDEIHLIHVSSNLCMEVTTEVPILRPCDKEKGTQKWMFLPIPLH